MVLSMMYLLLCYNPSLTNSQHPSDVLLGVDVGLQLRITMKKHSFPCLLFLKAHYSLFLAEPVLEMQNSPSVTFIEQ
ncbi:hypothetical protein Y032_0034g2891 [Ancylostoma ceylanicum]|uniref:Uncharacterized protein n=1 Tax=Ancylostoma ceylanicum TaxID=53326 RepID=A0A016UN17_9BILA|nr:hypothetical protein Y032_0034g2891 [Ancylostoma ceylanicum]